jgi:hypothetical protein
VVSPIGNPLNQGDGTDQLKALVQGWVRDEIRSALQGGNGIHVDGLTGDLVADRGLFRSMNFLAGVSGWGMSPNGNAEFNDVTFRGGVIGGAALASQLSADFNSWTAGSNTTLPGIAMVDLGSFTVPVPLWATQYLAVGVGTCQVAQQSTTSTFSQSATQSLVRLTIGAFARSAYGLTTFYSEVGAGPTTATLTQVATPVTIAKGTIVGGSTLTATLAASRQGGSTGWAQGGNAQAFFLFIR